MKCITVCQPWSWGIVHSAKRVENRTWYTSYRGPLLIHAGKSHRWLGSEGDTLPGLPPYDQLDYGAIIGVCVLTNCVRVELAPATPFTEGPWCWLLADVEAFAKPIPYSGRQMLFDVPDEVVRHMMPKALASSGRDGPT